MATNKNITMKQFNGTDYDTLYPKTIAAQIDDVYSKDETYPKSQLYTKEQILADATKTLYGLGSDAVPDDVFRILGAELRVITEVGTVVTVSKDGVTLRATADSSGFAVFGTLTFGEWTVTAGSTSKTINIDAIAVFYLVMSDLESLSWSRVAAISKMGLASTMFHIGDEKTLTVNGVSYTAVIIGFDHDVPVDIATYGRSKAGITWQLKNCINRKYQMNSINDNSGGWASCAMRTSTMATLLSQLASDLKNAIVKVKKFTYTGYQSTTTSTTNDFLFLLSEVEIFGSTKYTNAGEGSQYEYYQFGNSRVKTVNGSASEWWERSSTVSSSNNFCLVKDNGDDHSQRADGSEGVSFAFCV